MIVSRRLLSVVAVLGCSVCTIQALAQTAPAPVPAKAEVLTTDPSKAPWVTLMTGALGAVIGGVITLVGAVYTQRRGTNAVRRWIFQNHFDLLQDVADCAWNYAQDRTFGIFRDRVVIELAALRGSLEKDSTGGLANKEYASIYRSLSNVEYMVWAYDCKFESTHMIPYINACLRDMKEAQSVLGAWPQFRPNAATEYLDGTAALARRD